MPQTVAAPYAAQRRLARGGTQVYTPPGIGWVVRIRS